MQASSVVAARHTIVTGGSSGIGLALVRRLAGLGARTSVIALDDEDLVRLRQSQPSATCAGIIRPGYFMEATQPRQAPPARVRRG